MKKFLALTLMAALCAMLVSTSFVSAQNSGQNPSQRATDARLDNAASDGRYVNEFHSYGPDAVEAVLAAGGEVIHQFPEFAAVAARLPEQALRGLRNNPNVRLIEADARRYPMQTTTSWSDKVLASGETLPYGIQMVQADQLSDASAGTRKVCIIDSGYFLNHDDLQDGNVTATYDTGTGDPFTDGDGHGTHVAGTIAAMGGNSKGVVGTLPGSKIGLHIVKVFGDNGGWAYSSDLANAVGKCRDAGANVISMSLGGTLRTGLEEQAFNNAYNAGVLSIAAAGNAGDTSTSYPAGYGSVVSVAAVDNNENVADFSQKNSDVEIAAPGVAVFSTVPYIETNTLTVDGITYKGNYIENAARTAGVTAILANGGRCAATDTTWSGKVVLCERGDISFLDKVRNVQNSGGAAAVIYNNVSGGFFGTLGDGNSSTIPAISLSQEDGQYLVANKLNLSGTVVSKVDKAVSGYDYFNGTSMATPHVSGVAALVWSYNTAWTNAQIRDALNKTAKDKGVAGRDTSYGYGIAQAKAALDYLQANGGGGGGTSDTTAPVISNVASRKLTGGSFEITWTTDEASNSEVRFTKGATGTYTNSSMVTSHRMSFRGTKGVLYEYYVSSTDAAGNKATSGPYTHRN